MCVCLIDVHPPPPSSPDPSHPDTLPISLRSRLPRPCVPTYQHQESGPECSSAARQPLPRVVGSTGAVPSLGLGSREWTRHCFQRWRRDGLIRRLGPQLVCRASPRHVKPARAVDGVPAGGGRCDRLAQRNIRLATSDRVTMPSPPARWRGDARQGRSVERWGTRRRARAGMERGRPGLRGDARSRAGGGNGSGGGRGARMLSGAWMETAVLGGRRRFRDVTGHDLEGLARASLAVAGEDAAGEEGVAVVKRSATLAGART
ncbi:hypothetical protein JHW43_004004 [Diplocarpon mali]|nr:hypothetical protein JHW43_004004 [Diplocarpon mali]